MLEGRDPELELLRAALGASRPMVVVGPAGIGKSSLCRAALEGGGPWRESGALATLRWAPLLMFRRLIGADLREAVDLVAAQVLREEPGALLLEDLQWADERSLDVTARLAGRLPILATVRSLDPGSGAAVARLTEAGFEALELPPLPAEASEAVVRSARPELDEGARALIIDQAGGNPLLLTELRLEADPADQPGSSPTLVRALQARLADQPEPVREAMNRLSVLGRPAPPDLLGSGAEALVVTGLAHRDDSGHLVVHHALLAEAVESALGPDADRVRRELADLVEPAEGAFLLARAGDAAEARRRALDAADRVERKRVAVALLTLAAACAPPGDLDAPTRIRAGVMLNDLGEGERSLALCLPEGVETLDPVDRGALRGVAAAGAWAIGDIDRFTDLIELAVDDLRGSDSEFEVMALALSSLVDTRLRLDASASLDRARYAVDLADRIGMRQALARWRLASVLLTSGRSGWRELYEEVIEEAERTGDHKLQLTAMQSLVLAEWVTGDLDRARAAVGPVTDQQPPQGFETDWLVLAGYAAILGLLAAEDRVGHLDRWLPLHRDEPLFRDRAHLEAAVAVALADVGRHREARSLLADPSPHRNPQLESVHLWAAAEAAWLAGRPEEAIEAGGRAEALGIGDYPSVINARLIAGHARRDLGEPVTGPAPSPPVPAWAAAPHEWAGLVAASVGDPVEAGEHFDSAAEAWAPNDLRSELRARWAAAEAAVAAGRSDALDRVRAVEAMAVDRQVESIVARSRRTLRSLGVARASSRQRGVVGLTSREVEVLRLVGAGFTSNQIAAELHIAPSTVDSLVRSAMRRLGAPNRRTAAAVVARADSS